jgi:primosomal protein N' (replication factor Y)
MKIVRVGLDVPVPTLFDYRADDARETDVGQRVLVPFGRRIAIGVIFEVADATALPDSRLKTALRILRDPPTYAAEDLQLIRFAAEYYHHPLGAALMAALPSRLRRPHTPPAPVSEYVLTAAGTAVGLDQIPARAGVQRRLLAQFHAGPALDLAAVRALAASAPAALKQFLANGWVERRIVAPLVAGDKVSTPSTGAAPALTAAQSQAVGTILQHTGSFQAFLLLGVTGSGKTEVYLHVIDAVLRAGRQALLLVPEIALTPQLEASVKSRFPDTPLVSLHSGLNETERLDYWLAARSGRARIVLGTRLAVFAPLPELGVIVVDEEHDPSFKQAEGLRYSARDMAVIRAQQRGIPIVLGSATPSLESYQNALSARYVLLELKERIGAALPRIHAVETRAEKMDSGLSRRLLDAIAQRLASGEQSMVFINRRGYAPVLMCHGCGWLSGCHRCSAQLVLHLKDGLLRCHHCGHAAAIPRACPDCGNADLSPVGQGTQRVETALAACFPEARILRIDRDSTRRKAAWQAMRTRIHAREVDILVGTQILAKGHDFPHLSLVGVLNADSLLYSSDYRASERLFALLTQVAGRAGRGDVQGEVLVQTEFVHHPLYEALCAHDVSAYARTLLEERRVAGFPPFVYQALLRAEAPRMATALEFLERAVSSGRAMADDVLVYDPVPAAMARLAGRERAQLLVQSPSRPALHAFLRRWQATFGAERATAARWSLDVDPLEI